MEEQEFVLLLRLLTAHLLADFILQPDHWVVGRQTNQLQSKYFWLHIGVLAITTYLLLADWDNWLVPLIITGAHLAIDAIKIRFSKDTTAAFALDQVAHIIVIILVWLGMTEQWEVGGLLVAQAFEEAQVWLIILGYLINSIPLAVSTRYLTRGWNHELESETEELGKTPPSLTNAGKWIGILERLLIFTLILFNELRGLAFCWRPNQYSALAT